MSNERRNTGISQHLPEGTVLSRLVYRDWRAGFEDYETATEIHDVTVALSNWAGITVTDDTSETYLPSHIVMVATIGAYPDVTE